MKIPAAFPECVLRNSPARPTLSSRCLLDTFLSCASCCISRLASVSSPSSDLSSSDLSKNIYKNKKY